MLREMWAFAQETGEDGSTFIELTQQPQPTPTLGGSQGPKSKKAPLWQQRHWANFLQILPAATAGSAPCQRLQ